MADTITVPGLGPTKKVYVYAGAAGVTGLLVMAYWRSRQAPVDAAATTTPTVGDAGLTDGYTQYSDAGYGNVIYPPVTSGGGQAYSQYGYDVYGNPLPAPTGATGTGGIFASNRDWAGAAVDELVRTGVTEQVASLAISKVLGGLPVTVDQQSLFLQAIGVLGQPPQGYPAIKLVDTPAHPKPPAPGSGGSKPPVKLPATSRVFATKLTKSFVRVGWNPVHGAARYRVEQKGGTGWQLQGYTTVNQYSKSGLRPGQQVTFRIAAVDSHGTVGNYSAPYTRTLPKR